MVSGLEFNSVCIFKIHSEAGSKIYDYAEEEPTVYLKFSNEVWNTADVMNSGLIHAWLVNHKASSSKKSSNKLFFMLMSESLERKCGRQCSRIKFSLRCNCKLHTLNINQLTYFGTKKRTTSSVRSKQYRKTKNSFDVPVSHRILTKPKSALFISFMHLPMLFALNEPVIYVSLFLNVCIVKKSQSRSNSTCSPCSFIVCYFTIFLYNILFK